MYYPLWKYFYYEKTNIGQIKSIMVYFQTSYRSYISGEGLYR